MKPRKLSSRVHLLNRGQSLARPANILIPSRRRKPVQPPEVPVTAALRRILVPVDFSGAAAKSLEYAMAIARAHAAKIVLLHITPPISFCVDCGYGPVSRQVPDAVQAKKDRAHLKKTAAKYLPREFFDAVVVRSGKVPQQILQSAKELAADLIVLYAHRSQDRARLDAPTVADQVVRQAECPVLVVRSAAH